jgi:transposase, IS5 family
MKMHLGVNSKTKLLHSAIATDVNVHNSQLLDDLLHGEETRVWRDSAYAGQQSALKKVAPRARDFTQH